MKKVILSIVLCSFLCGSLCAQDILLLKSFWKGSYLHNESGMLQVSDVNPSSQNAQWYLLDVGNEQYQLKNVATNTYLNFAQNQVSSVAESTAAGTLWVLEKLPEGDHVRIKNAQHPDKYLNIERGLTCSAVESYWHSAMWFLDRPAATPSLNSSAGVGATNTFFNQQLVLDAHNQLRAEVGVPPLVWDDRLAGMAQNVANGLALKNTGEGEFVLEHSRISGIGENLAAGFAEYHRPELLIFDGWGIGEKANFNPVTKNCYDNKICGHYKQVVWRKTTRVGCAVKVNENGKYILVCNYEPRGNFNGETPF